MNNAPTPPAAVLAASPAPPAAPKPVPIHAEHLPAVGAFLHENLNRRFSAQRWIESLTHPWAADAPNFGMQLLEDGRIVGVFCAIYSDQVIRGQVERFCNPHSWCVLESHRRHSIGLILQIIRQPGYHFTMFTPNPKVAEVFRGLKFKELDNRMLLYPNLPSWQAVRTGSFAVSAPAAIEAHLSGQPLAEYLAHRSIPWLRFAAFGDGQDACLAIYKPVRVKRLPVAWVMHVSSGAAFERLGCLLRQHLLLRHGFLGMRIESRWLSSGAARGAHTMHRRQPKLYMSKTLGQAEIHDVYSELMSLDV
jgi:hypothetical protein